METTIIPGPLPPLEQEVGEKGWFDSLRQVAIEDVVEELVEPSSEKLELE